MPEVVTHRYDPARGVCRNICALSDVEASQVIDRLRRETRPNLKADYLARRRATEDWLLRSANEVLGRVRQPHPSYFFLGDFSFCKDLSRPASLILPLAALPLDSITFTFGDSMSVAAQSDRRIYNLEGFASCFATASLAGFGLSDQSGWQKGFIEVQLWSELPSPLELK